jgi:hypothetical protein
MDLFFDTGWRHCHPFLILWPMKNINKSARSHLLTGLVFVSLFCLAACSNENKNENKSHSDHPSADAPRTQTVTPTPTKSPGSVIVAGITFTPPAQWKNLGASGMRQAQFSMPAVAGDTDEGTMNVFYFGPASGGGTEANLQRWIGQITQPDNSDSAAVAEHGTFVADGMAGHMVSLNGTYKKGSGRPMGGDATFIPGYRLVGMVLEGPEGSLFFKLTGPEATARAMEEDFLKMVQGAHQ